jgi:hypothetical protein
VKLWALAQGLNTQNKAAKPRKDLSMTSSDLVTAIVVLVIFGSVTSLIAYGLTLSVRYRRRVLQNQERMAALEKGVPLPELIEEQMAPWSGRIYLLRGMMWLFSGIAIVAFLSAIAAYSRQAPSMESRVYRTLELKRLGATEEQIKEADAEPSHIALPGAFALLGLVPIGIGLAYLISYAVERKSGGATTPC